MMSKAKMGTNPNSMPSFPNSNFSRPSGSSPIATSNDPEMLAFAVRFGNRATRRLAMQKFGSNSHRKLMKSIGVTHE